MISSRPESSPTFPPPGAALLLVDIQDSALLLVDIQNDFCPGGALPVPGGERVIPVLNAATRRWGKPLAADRERRSAR